MKSYYKELVIPIILIVIAILGLIFNIEIEIINYTLGQSGGFETKLFFICLIIVNITIITEILYQEREKHKIDNK